MDERAKVLGIQHGGDHYKGLAIEPAEYCHRNQLGFLEGNVVKLVSRHEDKGGALDIQKAIHFCQMLLEWEYAVTSKVEYVEQDDELATQTDSEPDCPECAELRKKVEQAAVEQAAWTKYSGELQKLVEEKRAESAKPETFDFQKALELMAQGKRVRRRDWPKESYIDSGHQLNWELAE